jgi:TIR domain/Pentapeptide repeats (8 copies)
VADKTLEEILTGGVGVWNDWRRKNPLAKLNFIGISLLFSDLAGADLKRADFSGASLRGCDLTGANLENASVQSADLMGVKLGGAKLSRTMFVDTDLGYADLRNATITEGLFVRVRFDHTALAGADVTNGFISDSRFIDVDLSRVKGLETVKVRDPSPIDINTIYRSSGKIPEQFLRNCGVPENFIRYIPSLVNSEDGLQFYSCFISYSSKDEEFARRLHGRMRDAHLRVWFAPEDVQGGKKLHEQIETAIRVYDKLLIVLSEASLKSEWVMTEIRKARRGERETGKRKLFPVRLVDFETLRDWECFDADGGKDLAVELREYYIPDFSDWKNHDAFEEAFDRLLKDLRAESSPAE